MPNLTWSGLAGAGWPVLLGLMLALLAWRVRFELPSIPPGDLVVPVERLSQVLGRLLRPRHGAVEG